MRNYQVEIRIPVPVLLSSAGGSNDLEAMFRFLNDLMTDVSLEIHEQAESIISDISKRAIAAGYVLKVPNLAVPMGVGYCLNDVTGQVGRRWTEKE